jgi:hypothetical protein
MAGKVDLNYSQNLTARRLAVKFYNSSSKATGCGGLFDNVRISPVVGVEMHIKIWFNIVQLITPRQDKEIPAGR